MPRYLNVLAVCLCGAISLAAGDVRCKDESGQPTNWFIVYKLPTLPNSDSGFKYAYMDTQTPSFSLSSHTINDSSGGAIASTLAPLYDNPSQNDIAYALYNDEHPDGRKSEYRGHTKGVVAFDEMSGFWLIHSTPKFPSLSTKYDYPEGEARNGQTFLCVTFRTEEFEAISRQLAFDYPWIYANNSVSRYNVPTFVDVLNGRHVTSPPFHSVTSLTSATGGKFISFAKYSSDAVPLYDVIVAPYFRDGLRTETWQNGIGKMSSNCTSGYQVENVKTVNLLGFQFDSTKDHSKWAITTTSKWVCIGDLNRQTSQSERAGGTLCFESNDVWESFNKIAVEIETC
ncbi:plancitoxin-1-like [Oscarella lobularis]|uniref:plancitoxin-1-like n=1 Tax=Oscarella lobularis TaxID=121494 RepID=UPI003313F93F